MKSTCADLRQKFLLARKKLAGILASHHIVRSAEARSFGPRLGDLKIF